MFATAPGPGGVAFELSLHPPGTRMKFAGLWAAEQSTCDHAESVVLYVAVFVEIR